MQHVSLSSRTGFVGTRLAARPSTIRARAVGMPQVRAAASGYQWLKKEPIVILAGFLGWFAPSNIGVPALGGKSLFGLFSESIGQELSHFPVGPALTDNFWLYLVTWHVGLFLTLFLGQIGVRGRAQGYFD